MKRQSILIVDDDPKVVKFVQEYLEARDFLVITAADGREALYTLRTESPDLVILDLMLPGIDGLEVCNQIRIQSQVPIIMLSASGNTRDKVRCLSAGADDYVTKPFAIDELVARICAVLRRKQVIRDISARPTFTSGDLVINFNQRKVTVAGKEVNLTWTEYSLLEELALNAGKVVKYDQLLNNVWGPEYMDEREYVHVAVRRLRVKIEPGADNPKYIINSPRIGYILG
jgi:two-component system KDP operon response regulator KdpE